MAAPPISIKLRCASWKQLAAIYERDLARGAVFLKSAAPPPVGTRVRINLTLPTQTLIVLNGSVDSHVAAGELNGRGPGVDIKLHNVPQSALWLIESALESARRKGAMAAAPPANPSPGATPADDAGDMDMGTGEKLVEAEDELIAALSQELASLRKLNPFQVLGVGYETSDDEVRAAFGSLTKRYHPDRFARYESGEARRIAEEIFILIRNAYQLLDTTEKRSAAVETLRKKRAARAAAADARHMQRGLTPVTAAPPPVTTTPATTTPVTTTPATTTPAITTPATTTPAITVATVEVTTAATAATAATADPAATTANAEPGPGIDSENDEENLETAYARLDAGNLDEALRLFRLTSVRNPGDRAARIGLELAEGLKALGDRDRLEAAQRFEAVLELDPTNERAARELAEMRRQATNERKGLLTRLLNQKE